MAAKARSGGKRKGEVPGAPASGSVPIKYVESNSFRVVPVHGFLASVNPGGDFFLASWYQHSPLPSEGAVTITSQGASQHVVQSSGLIREFGIALSFSADVAAHLVALLQRQLEQHFTPIDQGGEQ
jgi:hypothetical protein